MFSMQIKCSKHVYNVMNGLSGGLTCGLTGRAYGRANKKSLGPSPPVDYFGLGLARPLTGLGPGFYPTGRAGFGRVAGLRAKC